MTLARFETSRYAESLQVSFKLQIASPIGRAFYVDATYAYR